MKHFVIEVTYKVSLDQIDEILPKHRAFLQTGYEKGWLLMSGPQNPRTGGLIIARAPSLAEITKFFENDPYYIDRLADYRFIEFEPVKKAAIIDAWVN